MSTRRFVATYKLPLPPYPDGPGAVQWKFTFYAESAEEADRQAQRLLKELLVNRLEITEVRPKLKADGSR